MNSEYLHVCTKPEKQLPGSLKVSFIKVLGSKRLCQFHRPNIQPIKISVIYVNDKIILTNILALSVNILIIRSQLVT